MQVSIWGKRVLDKGHSPCKALGQDCAWHVGGTARRPMWLEQSQGRGGGMRAGCARLCGLLGGLGLLSEGRWVT